MKDPFDVSDWDGDRAVYAKSAIGCIFDEDCEPVFLSSSEECVGIAAIRRFPEFVFIESLATKRAGFGRKLMAEILKLGTVIELWSVTESRGFYRKLGFWEREPGHFFSVPHYHGPCFAAEL